MGDKLYYNFYEQNCTICIFNLLAEKLEQLDWNPIKQKSIRVNQSFNAI